MKKTIICLILIFSCGEGVREEIIDRYSNGNKQTVVTYKGKGKGEQIINRVRYYNNGNVKMEESFKSDKTSEKEYYKGGDLHRVREYNSDEKMVFEEIYYSGGNLARKFTVDEDIYYDWDGNIIDDGINSYITDAVKGDWYPSGRRALVLGFMQRLGIWIDWEKKVLNYNRILLNYHGDSIDKIRGPMIPWIIYHEMKQIEDSSISLEELIAHIFKVQYYIDGGNNRNKVKMKITKEDIKLFFNEHIEVFIARAIHKKD